MIAETRMRELHGAAVEQPEEGSAGGPVLEDDIGMRDFEGELQRLGAAGAVPEGEDEQVHPGTVRVPDEPDHEQAVLHRVGGAEDLLRRGR